MRNCIYISVAIIALCLSLQNTSAQPLTEVPYNKMLETADQMMKLRDYYNAEDWYDQAYRESRDPNIAAQLGYLSYVLRNYDSSQKRYARLLDDDEDNIFIDERYYYGMSLKALGQYNEANAELTKFIEMSSEEELKPFARLAIQGMKEAGQLEENIETAIQFMDGDINSAFVEYSPRLYTSGDLYFSAIPAKKVVDASGGNDDQYSKIYVSTLGEDGAYSKPEELEKEINRPGFHTGNVSFTPDGKYMYFTRSKLDGNDLDKSELYYSEFDGEEWSPAYPVTSLNGEHIITHPVVGELFGNEVLFFTSDMEGGEGGMDLFYATFQGESDFSAPVNLGPSLNTPFDEVTPYYLNGSLYFSSDGHPGLGGYDIFKADWDGVKWSEPENLGYIYNTTFDDMNIAFDKSGNYGFLVSNRPDEKKRNMKSKTCCDDIYLFSIRQIIIDLNTVVLDANGPLNGASVGLIDKSGIRSSESKEQEESHEFSFILDPERSYKVHITKEGYYPDSIEFNTVGILDDFTITKEVTLRPLPADATDSDSEPEFETITINQPIRLNKIYYDFDKWDILPEAEIDLNIIKGLMDEYPDMVIELSSHTDIRGPNRYNQTLSQKRAQSAKDWLVERAIADERIRAVGYGEEIILNRCVQGTRCSEEEHRFNRRTEFKIVEGPTEIRVTKEILKGATREGSNE